MVASKGSARLTRINAEIAQQFALYVLYEVDDVIIKSVQVTRAEVSKDLSSAKLFYLIIRPLSELAPVRKGVESRERSIDLALDSQVVAQHLKNIAANFRRYLAQQLNLRKTPECRFYFDEQAVKTQHILDLLAKI